MSCFGDRGHVVPRGSIFLQRITRCDDHWFLQMVSVRTWYCILVGRSVFSVDACSFLVLEEHTLHGSEHVILCERFSVFLSIKYFTGLAYPSLLSKSAEVLVVVRLKGLLILLFHYVQCCPRIPAQTLLQHAFNSPSALSQDVLVLSKLIGTFRLSFH